MVDLPTRFFKVILPPTDGQTKLRIPRKFAGDHGHKLSGVVKLRDPTGGVWLVRLEKIGDLLWLCDGWEKFAKDHLISYGYFVIFNYKGNSTFHVHIFDLSATEVDYAHEEEDGDDAGAEYLLESPSFTVVLKKTSLRFLYVPARISKYLRAPGQIEVVDCDGKKWAVSIVPREGQDRTGERYLKKGWKTFVKEKNLRIGDRCVFELVQNDDKKLKVSTIYKTYKQRLAS